MSAEIAPLAPSSAPIDLDPYSETNRTQNRRDELKALLFCVQQLEVGDFQFLAEQKAGKIRLIISPGVLEPFSSKIEQSELTVDQFADFTQRSATAAKYNARSRKYPLEPPAALRISTTMGTGAF